MKFAVVSHVLPPSPSGQATVLYRLLEDISGDVYCLIGADAWKSRCSLETPPLLGPTFYLPSTFQLRGSGRFPRIMQWINFPLGVFINARRLIRILKQERCSAVVACTGADLWDLPAAYLASSWLRLDFIVYLFDYYSQQWLNHYRWRVATDRLPRLLEKFLLRHAAATIVTNEMMQADISDRYKVDSVIVHNPCCISDEEPSDNIALEGPIRIVYTGAIYTAHFDAFERLIAAIRSVNELDVTLHLYTPQDAEYLSRHGIDGPIAIHGHHSLAAMAEVQRAADILFLPLAFCSPYPEIIRTASPMKMGEYLSAGRPILVHAPSDSFLAEYFDTHHCGYVVSEPEVAKLAMTIKKIVSDRTEAASRSRRAFERARSDFDVARSRKQFMQVLGIEESLVAANTSASTCSRV